MSKYNYDSVKEALKNKGCSLNMTKQEFESSFKGVKTNINIISSCGHSTVVQFNNLLYSNTGVICKQCIHKVSEGSSSVSENYDLQKYKVIKGIANFCINEFDFKICCDKSMSDFVIKPRSIQEDLWLPLHIKTTKGVSHRIYGFHIVKDYKDMNIIFFAIEEQRIWIINSKSLNSKRLCIGEQSSIYDKYEVKPDDLIETLNELYNNSKKYNLNKVIKNEKEINDDCIVIKGNYVKKLVKSIIKRVIEDNNFNMTKFVKRIFKNIIERSNKVFCQKCNIVELYEKNKTGYCEKCYHKHLYESKRKVERPPYEQLKAEVQASSYVQVGKKYGVSDNAIRKWLKMYEKYES